MFRYTKGFTPKQKSYITFPGYILKGKQYKNSAHTRIYFQCTVLLSFIRKKLSNSAFIALMLVIMPFLNAQDNRPATLTMSEAVKQALENNPQIKNSLLRIEKAQSQKTTVWNFAPTEFTYMFGQIYSEKKDRYFEINQSFGSILNHTKNLRKAIINKNLQATAYDLAVRELTAEIKSAYTFWQYLYAKTLLLENEKEMYLKFAEIADLRYKSGDISLLKKSIAVSKVSEVTSRYLMATDELSIAENKLKQLMLTDGNFIPDQSEPEIYMVAKSNDSATYRGSIILKYFEEKTALLEVNEAVIKSQYFPEIKAGFFTQQIGSLNNLYGWQIGAAFPLWVPKQQAEVKQAKIESEIAFNEFGYKKITIAVEIENLLFELNKYFRQIRYFRENALPEAEVLLNTALSQLNTEEIDYTEYLQSISLVIQIRQDFYLAINNYNQTAIQLEIYGD
jgi:cobalt-zinc-cadmium resistance protein CzcA